MSECGRRTKILHRRVGRVQNTPSAISRPHARWRAIAITTLWTTGILACTPPVTPGAMQPATPAPSSPSATANQAAAQGARATLPGIPDLPDLVTVVPFYWKPNENGREQTKVVIPAEINGRRGNFVVDLGAPDLMLNRTFLRPNASGEVDTVLDSDPADKHRDPDWGGMDTAHATLRIGTLKVTFADPTPGNPNPRRFNAFLNHQWGNYAWVFAPRLGNIGLSVLEQFETIVDYPRRRLVLIRLDQAGHRLAPVPAYTPKWSAPLIDVPLPDFPGRRWWGVAVRPDGTLDTLDATKNTVTRVLDTGAPGNTEEILGYPFLSQFGVIGFNHRLRQVILYR